MNAHCDNLMSRSLAYLELKVGINLAEAVDGRMSRESVKSLWALGKVPGICESNCRVEEICALFKYFKLFSNSNLVGHIFPV